MRPSGCFSNSQLLSGNVWYLSNLGIFKQTNYAMRNMFRIGNSDVKLLNILIIELYDFVSGQNVDRGGGLIVKAKLHPQW